MADMEGQKSTVKATEVTGEEARVRATGVMEEEAGEGDSVLASSAEVILDFQEYQWRHKYKPRKPKYLNYVHTGYAWNKHNRTHYDSENPPLKIVQGYKFNVFYPDLIHRTKIPKYSFEQDMESINGETCIIKFQAGPPYEDIGFRIVNDEWDYSAKRGFKWTFERRILKLHFNFKRYSYRG